MELSQTLSIEVYDKLKKKIINNELMPGQLLMAQEVSKEMGISRTPVREAMVRLREEGFLVEATGRKFRVSSITWKFIMDLYQARILLEVYAIQQMKQNISGELLEQMRENIESLSKDIENKDYGAAFKDDAEFHWLIISCCKNSIITDWLNNLYDHQTRIRFLSIFADGRVTKTLTEHKDIYECLERGDFDTAIEKLRLHLNNTLLDLETSKNDETSLVNLIVSD